MSSAERAPGGIIAYFTQHRTAASVLMLVMLIIGISAATQIRSQFFPDVVIDTVNVRVDWQGAGPEEIDSSVVMLLEPALQGIEGVERTRAVSREGRTTLTLSFEPGWDMGRATDDVKAAVDSIRTLPEGVDPPEVSRGVWNDKVTEVVIFGAIAPEQLGRIGDDLVSRLYREGISRTQISGVQAPQIDVYVPQLARVRQDISLRQVAESIRVQSNTRPAGDLGGDQARLLIGDDRHSAEVLRNLVVRSNQDGSKLYLRNVAQVQVRGSDAGQAYFVGEQPAVLIRVDRASEGDAIAIQHRVESVVREMRATLPIGVEMRLINSRAEDISDRLDVLLENGVQGFVLVLAILFLFLSARTAIWVAAGIPVAMFAAIALMYVNGFTLNMMSLFALIITLGLVVDDAIVVAEHADYRARSLGESPAVAPVLAVQRMFGPVLSSTATTILAFVALFFIGGAFGSLINDIPFVVVAVLLASTLESFLILPSHMRHALSAGLVVRWYDWPSIQFNRGFDWAREVLFAPLMAWVIRLRYLVVALMILLLAMAAAAVIRGTVPWQFFTPPESASISGNFALFPGSSRQQSQQMMQELQRAVEVVAQRYAARDGINPVVHALAQTGGTAAKGLPGQESMDPDTLGSIDIGLVGADLRDFSALDFVRDLQKEVKRPANLAILSFRSQGLGPAGDSLAVNLYGNNSTDLKAAAAQLIAALGAYPEVTGLEDSLAYAKDEVSLQLTETGETLGFTTAALADDLFIALNGVVALEYPVASRTTEVRVLAPPSELNSNFLSDRLMRSPKGEYVPLGEIVRLSSQPSFATVDRDNGRRLVSVTGNLAEDNAERAAEIARLLRDELLPQIAARYNLEWELSGLALQEDEFLGEALVGFALCIFGIYLVLCWVFASWTRPLMVMAVIPFGLIGAVVGHDQFGLALSLFTLIGLIGMSGIIINDAIVLVTTIDRLSQRMALAQAAVEATKQRIRPILLTTLTTVLGLAPLMYESSRQALFLKPTVITLVYGLSLGFFVVLLMLPALVVIQDDLSRSLRSLRALLVGRRVSRALRWPLRLTLISILVVNLMWVGPFSFLGEPPDMAIRLAQTLQGVSPGLVTIILAFGLSLLLIAALALYSLVVSKPPTR